MAVTSELMKLDRVLNFPKKLIEEMKAGLAYVRG